MQPTHVYEVRPRKDHRARLCKFFLRCVAQLAFKWTHESPPEHREVTPGWIPARCARSKTDAPPSKNVRSNGRADPGPDSRDSRSDDRRLDSRGRIAAKDREVSGGWPVKRLDFSPAKNHRPPHPMGVKGGLVPPRTLSSTETVGPRFRIFYR